LNVAISIQLFFYGSVPRHTIYKIYKFEVTFILSNCSVIKRRILPLDEALQVQAMPVRRRKSGDEKEWFEKKGY
jgi:hypothetical protein